MDNDELKSKNEEGMEKIRTQAMLLGGKTIATVVYNKIQAAMHKPGKRSLNDYKRLVKDIEKFCKVAVDSEVETPTFDDETVQNECEE